ncbi:MAG: Mu-like prophage major head subunit gpT family protein [Pseudomonadota bacterium]
MPVWSAAFAEGVESLKDGIDIMWPNKATKVTLPGTETAVYGFLAEMPQFRRWIGEREPKRLKAGAYSMTVHDYEFSYELQRNDVKYDRFGIVAMHMRSAGVAQRNFYETLVNDAQAAGKTTLCVDGQYFYDTDHPGGFDRSGATFSNLRTGTPLTGANIVSGYNIMTGLIDANGQKMGIRPNILEYGSADWLTVKDIFESELTARAVSTALGSELVGGVSNNMRGLLQPMLNPNLESGVWYLHDTRVMKPFLLQEESAPTGLEMRIDPTDPHVWEHNSFLYGARATAGAGYTLPHLSQRNEVA